MTGNPDDEHRAEAPPLPGPVEDVQRPRTIISGPPAEDTPAWRADTAPATRPANLPAPSGQATTTVSSYFSETTRNGRWEVGSVLHVQQAFSEVLLDLREAVVTSSVVELRVTGAFMSCKVYVPPGVPVEWAGGASLFSEEKADPAGTEAGPGWRLRVVHNGAFSEIRVRSLAVGELEPKWWRRRR